MESTIKEMATVLRSTETMADQFAQQVQQQVGHKSLQTTQIYTRLTDEDVRKSYERVRLHTFSYRYIHILTPIVRKNSASAPTAKFGI